MDEFLHQDASADTKEGNSNPLTVQEQEELLECEKAIRMSREGTVEAATALLRIRDHRLYRGSCSKITVGMDGKWDQDTRTI